VSSVQTLFGFADLMIRGLEFDLSMHLGGEGKLVEEDSDGFVDRIEDGTYSGYVQSADGGMSSSAFSADWTATRASFDTNNL